MAPTKNKIFRRILIALAALNTSLLVSSGLFIIVGSVGQKPELIRIKQEGSQLYAEYACASCHGVNGDAPSIPAYPSIAFQSPDYIKNQIIDIRDGTRTNGLSNLMKNQIQKITDKEAELIAQYLDLLKK